VGRGAPVDGIDYPRTYQEFREWFGGDAACVEYLGQLRWPDGFACPKCGCERSWRTAKLQWVCAQCGQRTSVTAGTIFHRTRTPLSTWFAAAWFVTSQKNGVSAVGLQHALGFGSYETAWAWLHKLRRAMVRPDRDRLSGLIEVDETFVGGRSPVTKGNYANKIPVMVAVERLDSGRLGRVRFAVGGQRPSSRRLVEFACATIERGSTIHTDGAYTLRRLADLGYAHEFVTGYNAPDLDDVLPGVHLVASLLKRWIAGTLQHNVSHELLEYYLDEFAFRFNRRNSRARGMLFYRLLQQAVHTDPHPLSELYSSR
jgi:hypothetical protein